MKRILLLALLTLSSTAFANPTGKVRISIIRSEIVLVDKEYKFVTTLLCRETLPFTVQDIRGNQGASPEISDSCHFTEGGIKYQAYAYYVSAYSTYEVPGEPSYPTLGFMGEILILNEKSNPPPFTVPTIQAFFTKDLNLKNALISLVPDQSVICNPSRNPPTPMPFLSEIPYQEDCTVYNQLGIQAVFEYDID